MKWVPLKLSAGSGRIFSAEDATRRHGPALHWVRTLLHLRPPLSPAQQRAADLVKAVDAGGVPLNPARVNQIAGHLGLPVSKTEAVGDTVNRIRAHLKAEGL